MPDTLNNVYGLSACFGDGIFLEGTNANTIKSTVAFDYCIDGYMYTKAITDNIAMTACAAQAVLTTCLYTVTINSSGTIVLVKGDEVLTTKLSAGDAYLTFGQPAAGYVPCAYMKIVLASTATFTSGTTDLGAANVTETFAPLASMPADNATS